MDNGNPSEILNRYRRLIDVSQDLASILDLDTRLSRIIQVACELCAAREGFILLYDERRSKLFFHQASSGRLEEMDSEDAATLERLAGQAAGSRAPVILPTRDGGRRKDDSPNPAGQCWAVLAVPMITRNRLMGVLVLVQDLPGEFGKQDLEIIQVLAADAAIAIENAYLFQQTDLITDLVHELRTPLASLNTLSSLLQRPEISEQQRLGFARTIQKETQRLNELAANFLDLALLESGRTRFQRRRFDPLQMLDECCQVIEPGALESGIEVQRDLPTDLPYLIGDRDKIKQVIFNLFSNAVKYNQPGGKIYVRAWAEPGALVFEIKDTGIGIPEESMPYLFEKFYRASTSTSGAGLGLSISKRIVESHGGSIEAQSQLGAGTTFTIRLPR